MKTKRFRVLIFTAIAFLSSLRVIAQDTAFSYQGRLTGGGNPVNGIYELRFSLYNAGSGGSRVGNTVTNAPVTVNKGLFTVTLDFGANAFTGAPRWLEIGVRTNGGGAFRTLGTRQFVTAEPYSLFAARAGAVDWTNIIGIPIEFADGIDNVNTYLAGTGLSLAGTTFDVNFGGNGSASTSARSDHNHVGQPWLNWTNIAGIPAGSSNGYTPGIGLVLVGNQLNVNFGTNGVATTAARSDHNHLGQPWLNWTNIAGAPALSWSNLTGIPAGFADGIDNDTTYSAGTGLLLGGTTFSVNFGGNGAAATSARSDHNHHGQTWVGTNLYGLSVQSTASNGTALYGLVNSGALGNGVFGESTATNGTGVYGRAFKGTSAYGVFGEGYFGVVGSGSLYGVNAYSQYGYALFAESGGDSNAPQVALLQDNTNDYCRLSIGVSGAPTQWQIAVGPGNTAIPAMFFHNGATNVVIMDFFGNVRAKTFTPSSDRAIKEDFASVNPREVLERVTQLPIQTWKFKEDGPTRHIGPMAQDFHAAFHVGPDDKHIATVDADGVALAAIQGLNQIVSEKDARIEALEKRLAQLEKLVATLAGK